MTAPLDRSATWPYDAAGEPGPYSYARAEQPNAVSVEKALGALEGGRSLLFPAGMGAVTGVVLTMLPPGGTIALAEGAYYGHKQLFDHLRPWGVNVVEYDQTGPPPADADLILIEAPSNPMLTMPDFEAAAAHPAPVVCDATLASPLRLRPLELGCDVSLHSATKVLAGHDDLIAGVATVKDDDLFERLHLTRRLTGLVASADTAWLLERGLKTLEVQARPDGGDRARPRRAPRRPPRRHDRPLPGLRVPDLLRRRRRRRGPPRRDRDRDDRERDEPRRRPHEARVAAPLGGRRAARRGCCGCRSGSRASTRCGPTSSRRSRPPDDPRPGACCP